ncbi:hypothetical protein QBC46DRAFT_433364 [Diplogelasinospora grovesii]|uniref:Uncharacterized protein n=1 Tax=Diplogelasinospora grovesii TaxID=303347 RepID=A0AAN6NG72_9PEZI|nr:hypothetical protein QBC46DRAFT_433364 [Diplogelasinospora grovesii]
MGSRRRNPRIDSNASAGTIPIALSPSASPSTPTGTSTPTPGLAPIPRARSRRNRNDTAAQTDKGYSEDYYASPDERSPVSEYYLPTKTYTPYRTPSNRRKKSTIKRQNPSPRLPTLDENKGRVGQVSRRNPSVKKPASIAALQPTPSIYDIRDLSPDLRPDEPAPVQGLRRAAALRDTNPTQKGGAKQRFRTSDRSKTQKDPRDDSRDVMRTWQNQTADSVRPSFEYVPITPLTAAPPPPPPKRKTSLMRGFGFGESSAQPPAAIEDGSETTKRQTQKQSMFSGGWWDVYSVWKAPPQKSTGVKEVTRTDGTAAAPFDPSNVV